MARLIDTYTGGIGSIAQARTRPDTTGACIPFVTLSGKCLVRNQARMFDILAELAGQFSFEDTERLKNLLLEYRAALESMVIHNGHQLAISLASRAFSATAALSENWQGIHQLRFIKQVTEGLSAEALAALSADLAAIAETVFARDNLKMALIGEDEALKKGADLGNSLMQALGTGAGSGFQWAAVAPEPGLPREGWATSSAVSFVAETFPVVRLDHPDSAVLAVISKLLRSLYLHREIREKGGAYGGFALYSPEAGIFSFASYRDPHIAATLNVYRGAADFLLSDTVEDEDIKEAVLQVCSEIDKPDPPGPAARKAFYRRIVGISDEMRRRFKQNLLGITRQQVQQAAAAYLTRDHGPHAVAVISGSEQLEAANRRLKPLPLQVRRI
jgi:Zn-dependent M16 (insulinase) family peptidase